MLTISSACLTTSAATARIVGTSYRGEAVTFAAAHPVLVRALTVITSVARAHEQLRVAGKL